MRMSDPEILLFARAVGRSTHYLEYGAGGSTTRAVRVPTVASVTSVESDPAFLRDQLLPDPEVQRALASGRLRFLAADLGPTRAWGHPVDRSKAHLWPTYALCPYLRDYQPDLVLIDGRFRVACGLAAALQAPAATVLIHDYTGRRNYRILERFLQIEEQVDSLVLCRRRAAFDARAAQRLLEAYLYCPADIRGRIPQFLAGLRRRRAAGRA